MDSKQEAELISGILNGQHNLFAEVVRQHQQLVYTTCLGFTHNPQEAEDLSQEVFITVFQHLINFKGQSKLSTWLYRISINTSLNHLRNRKKKSFFKRFEELIATDRLEMASKQASLADNPEQKLILNQEEEAIQNAIESLSKNQRIAFTLSKYDDLSQGEIAEIMQISIGAVEQHLQRAKANLRKKLSIHYIK